MKRYSLDVYHAFWACQFGYPGKVKPSAVVLLPRRFFPLRGPLGPAYDRLAVELDALIFNRGA